MQVLFIRDSNAPEPLGKI